jgi:deoxyxylulose-5-phosphate synthase
MPRVLNIGWPDEFIPHGSRDILMKEYGLDAESVAGRLRDFVRNEFVIGGRHDR